MPFMPRVTQRTRARLTTNDDTGHRERTASNFWREQFLDHTVLTAIFLKDMSPLGIKEPISAQEENALLAMGTWLATNIGLSCLEQLLTRLGGKVTWQVKKPYTPAKPTLPGLPYCIHREAFTAIQNWPQNAKLQEWSTSNCSPTALAYLCMHQFVAVVEVMAQPHLALTDLGQQLRENLAGYGLEGEYYRITGFRLGL